MANGSRSAIVKSMFDVGLASQLLLSAIDWLGSTSYTQVTAGSPPALATGGDQITASAFGFKALHSVVGGITYDGTYEVIPYRINTTTWGLYWRVLSTGSQVAGAVNVSTSTVRLTALGI